jgi:hypothetical protein
MLSDKKKRWFMTTNEKIRENLNHIETNLNLNKG